MICSFPSIAPTPLQPLSAKADLQAVLGRWQEQGWLRPLDVAFASYLWNEVPHAPPAAILAAALVSHQVGRGHVCLDLTETLKNPAFALSLPPEPSDPGERSAAPLPASVFAGLTPSSWGAALAVPALVAGGAGATPLVLSGGRLYLRRYWQYEQDVAAAIHRRLSESAGLQDTIPREPLRRTLSLLFPRTGESGVPDWQKIACALAAGSRFGVITGGPGTGKTTTVVKLLALLQTLELATPAVSRQARGLRIRLAAPTGKAAARLNESIAGAVSGLPWTAIEQGEAVRAAIPLQVTTLHRLLGGRPDTRKFRHHAGNPLALDVLVIDEASMVDLEMMASVLAALPNTARLILLGDKDQLASVEAGAVLGELCHRAREGHFTPSTSAWLRDVGDAAVPSALIDGGGTALDQTVVMLRRSHRFAADSGIGRLANAVNRGDGTAVAAILSEGASDLGHLCLGDDEAPFRSLVIDGIVPGESTDAAACGYRRYLEAVRQHPAAGGDQTAIDRWAQTVLNAHRRFQWVCALRRGPWGVEGLNRRIAQALFDEGLIGAIEGWYPGRPVLMTRNDYSLGLMNGDIGVTLPCRSRDGQDAILRVAFPAGDGNDGVKWVLPSRLQTVETVFALTVHKSQGSEFEHVVLALPPTLNPILTRELIYTGITRARGRFTLVHPENLDVLQAAVARRVLRSSGLADALARR